MWILIMLPFATWQRWTHDCSSCSTTTCFCILLISIILKKCLISFLHIVLGPGGPFLWGYYLWELWSLKLFEVWSVYMFEMERNSYVPCNLSWLGFAYWLEGLWLVEDLVDNLTWFMVWELDGNPRCGGACLFNFHMYCKDVQLYQCSCSHNVIPVPRDMTRAEETQDIDTAPPPPTGHFKATQVPFVPEQCQQGLVLRYLQVWQHISHLHWFIVYLRVYLLSYTH